MFARKYILAAAPLLAVIPTSAAVPETPFPYTPTKWASHCKDWDEWDRDGPPFRVHGNVFYVGTCGISAILITGSKGHILIDGGTEQGAEIIAANITAHGLRLSDVKILLMSHEHHDHVGGIARLQQLTGARVLASPRAAEVIATGKAGEDDPQYGMHEAFPAARVDGTIEQGRTIRLGNVALSPVSTPGHTPGALSWRWRSCEARRCRTIVYADSLSPVSRDDYRFSDHPDYLQAYRASIARVAALDCDILLTPHPSASGMREKLLTDGLTSGMNCRDYAASITERLDARLAQEASGG
jgi:metallo-beta-lactamase class B